MSLRQVFTDRGSYVLQLFHPPCSQFISMMSTIRDLCVSKTLRNSSNCFDKGERRTQTLMLSVCLQGNLSQFVPIHYHKGLTYIFTYIFCPFGQDREFKI